MGAYTQSACSGKFGFPNQKTAEDSLSNKKCSRTAYRCKACDKWHVGGSAIGFDSARRYKIKKRLLHYDDESGTELPR